MVTTRKHPSEFPEPTSPNSNTSLTPHNGSASPSLSTPKSPISPSTALSTRRATSNHWAHTPSNLTLLWLALSLPAVIWDTAYILGRPLTMPGGSLHAPLWKPYALYGTVDYVYGTVAWDKKDGFGGAQGALNAVETVGYSVYLYAVYVYGREVPAVKGRGAPRKAVRSEVGMLQRLAQPRVLGGEIAAGAVLLLFAVSVMTVSKTVLYWLNEYFSGFAHIGHNDFMSLVFLWLIPNGLWLIFPSYIIYVTAAEIMQGLSIATGEKKRN